MRITALLFIIILFSHSAASQNQNAEQWADSVIRTMTLREKIGQLMMIAVYSNQNEKYAASIDDTIATYQPGAIVFFQGAPQKEVILMNRWQKKAKIPMLVAMDAEWGPAMRLDSIMPLPRLMALAATNDTTLIYRYGQAIGKQCKRLGIHINFAPVVDVNNNPLNPVINYRSFGENQHKVALYASVFCRGMQSQGVMAVAKHFPGHGNTSQDSHKTLPDVTDNINVIDSVHLVPFAKMIDAGIWGIMVAHVFVPALDTTSNIPTTLNQTVVTGLLKNEMGYKGVVITDALGMQGVLKHHKPGQIEVQALIAGNDVLLMPEQIKTAIDSIVAAVDIGRIDSVRIDESVRKILITKYNERLTRYIDIDEKNITDDINAADWYELKRDIFNNNATLVFNHGIDIPLRNIHKRIAVISFRADRENIFHEELMRHVCADAYFISEKATNKDIEAITDTIKNYDLAIVAVQNMAYWNKNNYGFNSFVMPAVETICRQTQTILCLFGNPYAYHKWSADVEPKALIVTYERDTLAEIACAQSLFGIQNFKGKLPVSISAKYPENTGITTETGNDRLMEMTPAKLGLGNVLLDSVDAIIKKAIDEKVFPGCQVLAAVNGKVFYNKAFGYHDYTKKTPVKRTDIYDLASVSKIFGTTLAIMKLYEEKRFRLDDLLQQHLPIAKNTAAGQLRIDRLLTHSSGLPAWLPLYKATVKNGKPDTNYYRTKADSLFGIRVSDSLFMRCDYIDTMLNIILQSKINPSHHYKYSDLGFMLLKEMAEHLSSDSLNRYVDENFYQPLGLSWMTYNPLTRFDKSRIPPTEEDTTFRDVKVHGYVHDQAAAMLGGVSGHAGVFGNAWDAAVILQMLIDKGHYAGTKYFEASTVEKFTSTYFDKNRRGLGFDKPSGIHNGNVCDEASPESYGHSGFTGTFVWADPRNGLVYIFLSNRTYPDAENKKIVEQNIRTRIHSLFYQTIDKP
ncbi:MAG: glycoside hydrolase family 3 N-terminal domain-containing protein [Bacteroidales bacterium]